MEKKHFIFVACCFFTITFVNFIMAQSQRELIEADWLLQAEAWRMNPTGIAPFDPNDSSAFAVVTPMTVEDAAGAVDGEKNGKYAFHTDQELNPWWLVDLKTITPISRVVVYNRLDYLPGLHNADRLEIWVSDDKSGWKRVYANPNTFFGGVGSDVKPLDVRFDSPVLARFVKLSVPNEKPVHFHLDEVEIYAQTDPNRNIAIGCPADQSSVSQWSVKKPSIAFSLLKNRFPTRESIERGKKLATFLKNEAAIKLLEKLDKETDNPEEAPKDYETAKADYLKVRWAVRKIAFSNPQLDFGDLLFVKRLTQQTFPDICLNHMPWVSRPGGDICILEKPFSVSDVQDANAEFPVRHLLDGKLGQGHVRGIDLHWDGEKIVFGFASQENFPFSHEDQTWPTDYDVDRRMGHKLRTEQEPIHLYETNTIRSSGK